MKIINYLDFSDNQRAERWIKGKSINQIAEEDGVKPKAVKNALGNAIDQIYKEFSVWDSWGDNIKISIKDLDNLMKSNRYYERSRLVVTNNSFLSENSEKLLKIIHSDLQETGKILYGTKLVYTNHWKGSQKEILNQFLSKIKPNEELVTIHNSVKSVYNPDHMEHVYAIFKIKEMEVKGD